MGFEIHTLEISSDKNSDRLPVSEKIYQLITAIKKAIESKNKKGLKKNLAELSALFRINTNESINMHNLRIHKILTLMQAYYPDAWKKASEQQEVFRDVTGNAIETRDIQRLPTIDDILAMEPSHGQVKAGPMTLPAIAYREAKLLEIYGVEVWKIARILNMPD